MILEIEIEGVPVVTNRQQSAKGAVLLFDGTPSNCACVFTARKGDAEAAFRAAAYTRRERFQVQRQTALPLETRGLLAEWDRGRLRVSGAAKLPFFNRAAMAAMMRLPVIYSDHTPYEREWRPPTEALERAIPNLDALTVLDERAAARVRDVYGGRGTVVVAPQPLPA